MWRLAVAVVLRLAVALCIGLAGVTFLITATGAVALLAGDKSLEGSEGTLGIAFGIVVFLLAVARIGHLAIGGLVDRGDGSDR